VRQRVTHVARKQPAPTPTNQPTPLVIGEAERRIGQSVPERLVVHELLEQLRIVPQHGSHRTHERLVVFDPRVLPVRVLPRVLLSRVCRGAVRNVLGDQLVHGVGIAFMYLSASGLWII
jgi:hypothetical protein